jgi:hypothetical protein
MRGHPVRRAGALTSSLREGMISGMARDEVDDTDMTPAEFRAAMRRGRPVEIVSSREAYEARVQALAAGGPHNGINLSIKLARVAHSTQNEPAAAH